MFDTYRLRPPRCYGRILGDIVRANSAIPDTSDPSTEERVKHPFSLLRGAHQNICSNSSPRLPIEDTLAKACRYDAVRLLESKKSSLSLSESCLAKAFPASKSDEETFLKVTPFGSKAYDFWKNFRNTKATKKKPYLSKRLMDAENSSLRVESSLANLARLSNVLCHTQGALACWLDDSKKDDDHPVPDPTPEVLSNVFSMANYLTVHMTRLALKAKAEVVLERRKRYFEAVKFDKIYNDKAGDAQDALGYLSSATECSLTAEAPLHGVDLFDNKWDEVIKVSSVAQRGVIDAMYLAQAEKTGVLKTSQVTFPTQASFSQASAQGGQRGNRKRQNRRSRGRGGGRGGNNFRGQNKQPQDSYNTYNQNRNFQGQNKKGRGGGGSGKQK